MLTFLKKRKNRVILYIVFSVLTLLALVSFLIYRHDGGVLQSQQEARRFRGGSEDRFAQVSAFFPAGDGTDEQGIYNLTVAVDKAFVTASLEAEEGRSLYELCYSGEGSVSLRGPKGSASAPALGVGGEFFRFHPLELVSGGYLTSGDVMHDRVVLDRDLAWRLFGATDVAGMSVLIGGEPYYVAGVIDRESDRWSRTAYRDGAGLFMFFDALHKLDENARITAVELTSADPISGFASGVMENQFSSAEVVENSSRFGLEKTYQNIGKFSERTMRTEAVKLPYWENAARLAENDCARALAFATAFIVLPVVMVITAAVLAVRALLRKVKEGIPELIERRREERFEQEQQRKREEKRNG